METKKCNRCKEVKPLEDFNKGQGMCRKCQSEYSKERIRKLAERKKAEKTNISTGISGLESYTPRQLLEELGKRGYDIEARYVQKVNVKAFVGIVK